MGLTFAFGRRAVGSDVVALWGAGLVATSPVFLYQLMNAMSDVPVTAFYMLALTLAVARRPLASGLAMSVAIAIRPNLAHKGWPGSANWIPGFNKPRKSTSSSSSTSPA